MRNNEQPAELIRLARLEDGEALKNLWNDCFDEEKAYLDWFFKNLFPTGTCVVAEVDGQIVSCAHSMALPFVLRKKTIPSAVITAVSTKKEYRGRGYMRKIMTFLMRELRKKGIMFVTFHPVDAKVYECLEQYPVSNKKLVPFSNSFRMPVESFDLNELYDCYCRFYESSSGILRTYEDFRQKFGEYNACGAKYSVVRDNGVVSGYCVYFEKDKIDADECVALSENAFERLKNSICGEGIMRVSPFAPLDGEVLPQNLMGVCNVRALLKTTGLTGGVIKITDSVILENNGTWSLAGEPTTDKPDIIISAGRLGQWIMGYKTMNELIKNGEATVKNERILKLCAALPEQKCYIIEEY